VIAGILILLAGAGNAFAQNKSTNLKNRQTGKPAIVFLVAGQSNAGGHGLQSPELYQKLEPGHAQKMPHIPGTTAKDVGYPYQAKDYRSKIWMPKKNSFQPMDPATNLRHGYSRIGCFHGMELPVVDELEERYPENDIYVIKYGPGWTNLYTQWNPERIKNEGSQYAIWLDYYRKGMAQLAEQYDEIRVAGLYWDQGETDAETGHHKAYQKNLTDFVAAVRRDTKLPELKFFIRKHIFPWKNIDAVNTAIENVAKEDPLCYMLDIDLGDYEKNFETWAFSPNNPHVSSKGFLELTKLLFDGPLRDAKVGSFDLYETNEQ
jgi:hypothetical protein